jgi:hypothetical protein
VRQACGFGCVTCGKAVSQYEHIDPPFEEAKEHDPEAIALLCGTCHDMVTRGIWSKEKIMDARRHPRTFEAGCSRAAFDVQGSLYLRLGSSVFEDVKTVIRRRSVDQEWLMVEAPEAPNGPYRLSAEFYDTKGDVSVSIHENEWICPTGVWDCDVDGRRFTVRNGLRNIVLCIVAEPPHGIWIERLKMLSAGLLVTISPDGTIEIEDDGFTLEMNADHVIRGDAVIELP